MKNIYDVRIRLNKDQTAFIAEEIIEENGVCSKSLEDVPFLPVLSEDFINECD